MGCRGGLFLGRWRWRSGRGESFGRRSRRGGGRARFRVGSRVLIFFFSLPLFFLFVVRRVGILRCRRFPSFSSSGSNHLLCRLRRPHHLFFHQQDILHSILVVDPRVIVAQFRVLLVRTRRDDRLLLRCRGFLEILEGFLLGQDGFPSSRC